MEFVAEPPLSPQEASKRRWENVVKELKNNPHQWGRVGTYAPGIATAIRRGKYQAFLEGSEGLDPEQWMRLHWQVRCSKSETRLKDDIYVKWVP